MKKIFLVLTVTAMIIISSSSVFANEEEEAHYAMITYSGTNAFANLLPEERQACMYWVSAGGQMNETCKSAVHKLITEEPDAVTPSQRRALLAVASGTVSARRSQTYPQPVPEKQPKSIENDNTGALIAAGVAAVVLGLVIHNNMGSSHHHRGYGPPPPRYRPVPRYHRMPPPRH